MPFMDGYECTRLITRLLRGTSAEPQIVAVTGDVEPEYQFQALTDGMSAVLSKAL